MLTISHLTKSYGQQKVLDIGNLSLAKGKLYMLVGSNGSGKTTLLRILAGLEKQNSGKVQTELSSSSIVMCFHKPYMFRGSVLHNVKMGLSWHNRTLAKGEVKSILEKLGLCHLKNRHANTLSAGESLRVSLARAAVLKPKLLLLDEPTASLDAESVGKMEDFIQEIISTGSTVFMASHLLEQADRMKAKLIRLEKGRLAPSEIENIFTGKFSPNRQENIISINKYFLIEHTQLTNQEQAQAKVQFSIPPNRIIISTNKTVNASPETKKENTNIFEAKIISLKDKYNSIEVKSKIEKGNIHLTAVIDYEKYKKLNLFIGKNIFMELPKKHIRIY